MRWLWVALAALCVGGQGGAAAQCRAQNILDACLRMQRRAFRSCQYDAWQCKCHAQKKILTCYDNCPEAEARTLQEMQVEVFCAALSGKELDSSMIDRMTRAIKLGSDQQQQHPTAGSSAASPRPTSAGSDAAPAATAATATATAAGAAASSGRPRDADRRGASYSILDGSAPPAPGALGPLAAAAAVAVALAAS
ncbi:hypothetical protein H4R18_005082 [Coemansia javaensis]|uniref:Extracellular membrane protein CFEM domain-containing protein n=1 Tax=Coemansia javaensis TaxID=2761396 RepID=A0A9W8H4B1_9FUNG|nr:hypothetical protein H4R18_005082 [Coemansia javaensis]